MTINVEHAGQLNPIQRAENIKAAAVILDSKETEVVLNSVLGIVAGTLFDFRDLVDDLDQNVVFCPKEMPNLKKEIGDSVHEIATFINELGRNNKSFYVETKPNEVGTAFNAKLQIYQEKPSRGSKNTKVLNVKLMTDFQGDPYISLFMNEVHINESGESKYLRDSTINFDINCSNRQGGISNENIGASVSALYKIVGRYGSDGRSSAVTPFRYNDSNFRRIITVPINGASTVEESDDNFKNIFDSFKYVWDKIRGNIRT